MKDFFRHNGIWVLIVSLVLTAGISVGSVFLPNLASPVGNLLHVLGTPFRAGANFFLDKVEGAYDYAFRYHNLEDQVAELQQQVAELEQQNRAEQSALEENQRLRALLDLSQARRDFVFEAATVTGDTSTSWESTLTISKGTVHGVQEGQCVVTENGYLVGVVADVGLNWATVTTIIDPEITMGARIDSSGTAAMLESDLDLMDQGLCRLGYLDTTVDIAEGDAVLTSGIGGTYPAGLTIGHIREVALTSSGMERYAVVEPAADLSALQEVFVIKEFDVVD